MKDSISYQIKILWRDYDSVEETAAYFRIGEDTLRRLISENADADYILRK